MTKQQYNKAEKALHRIYDSLPFAQQMDKSDLFGTVLRTMREARDERVEQEKQ